MTQTMDTEICPLNWTFIKTVQHICLYFDILGNRSTWNEARDTCQAFNNNDNNLASISFQDLNQINDIFKDTVEQKHININRGLLLFEFDDTGEHCLSMIKDEDDNLSLNVTDCGDQTPGPRMIICSFTHKPINKFNDIRSDIIALTILTLGSLAIILATARCCFCVMADPETRNEIEEEFQCKYPERDYGGFMKSDDTCYCCDCYLETRREEIEKPVKDRIKRTSNIEAKIQKKHQRSL